jgi:hypothetical protein
MWFFRALARIIRQPSFGGVLWAFVYFLYFSCIFVFPYFVVLACWVEDVNNFLTSSRGGWASVGKCCYLCIRLSLFGADLLLQLKISHGLVDFDVIDRS